MKKLPKRNIYIKLLKDPWVLNKSNFDSQRFNLSSVV